jgi:IS6 family transposase
VALPVSCGGFFRRDPRLSPLGQADAAAAKRFLAKALGRQNHPVPRVINTDKHAAYPPAIVQLKDEGVLDKPPRCAGKRDFIVSGTARYHNEWLLEENCQHRPVQYLNNVLEQDHRAIKRRVRASQHFRSFWGAWRTIAGYEAIHMIRKGQACWSAMGTGSGLLHRFVLAMFGIVV